MNIIVSGTSKGIGFSIVDQLIKEDHNILALSRSKIGLQSSNLTALQIDLSEDLAIDVIKDAIGDWESVDVIINNAGQLINKAFIETTTIEFKDQFNANYLTAVHVIKAAFLKLTSHSHIVNVSSMGGLQGSAKYSGLSAYSSSKGALITLTECLAEEFKGANKGHVNALALGAVQTEMLEKAFPGYEAPILPKDMAGFIIDFALSKGKFFNGKILPIALINP